MRIRILALAGAGEWPQGAVVEVEDRRAQRLIRNGYAEAVKDKPKGKEK